MRVFIHSMYSTTSPFFFLAFSCGDLRERRGELLRLRRQSQEAKGLTVLKSNQKSPPSIPVGLKLFPKIQVI